MSRQHYHKQEIDALTAWRVLCHDVPREHALLAWRELIEGIPVIVDNVMDIVVEATGTMPDLTFSIYSRDRGVGAEVVTGIVQSAYRDVPDTEAPPIEPLPVEAADIADLVREAIGAMESLRTDARQYAGETEDAGFVSRLERLQQIAGDTLIALREVL